MQSVEIKYNDPVFTQISKEIDYKMTNIALYISFKRHQRLISGKSEQVSDDIEKTLEDRIGTPSSETFTEIIGLRRLNLGINKIFVCLDTYELKNIKPLVGYKKRSDTSTYNAYKTLPKYRWSCMLIQKIWLHSQLPCLLTLKKQRIRDDSIKIIGTCSQCNAKIDIKSNKITDKFASFFCKVSNNDKVFKHSIAKKSKLTPFSPR